MTQITPIPTGLVEFVTRFPGLTASGISQLMGKKSDWASGALNRMVKKGRLARRNTRGMKSSTAWRYYPSGHKDAVCPQCRKIADEAAQVQTELQRRIHRLQTELTHHQEILSE